MSKQVLVNFDLTNAWEEWIIEVPDDADPNDLDFSQIEFVELTDAGNSGMTIVDVR